MESPLNTVRLEVGTGDEATEVFVMDSNYERVGRAVGSRVQFELPPGMYNVKVKSGDTYRKQLINLKKNQTVVFEPVAFDSPAPLEGTGKTHEFHMDNAATHSRQINKTIGAGCALYLFVRDWTTEARTDKTTVGQPALGLTIRTTAGVVLIDVASDEFPGTTDWEPWKACHVVVDPGTYLLTLEKPNGDLIQQTITTCAGWQTQVFLLLKDYGTGPDSRRADLANASIYMAQLGLGFNPYTNSEQNTTARLTELARRGLVNNRRVLTEQTLRDVLTSKFVNPILGIMGGHLLLLEETVNEALLRVVVSTMRSLLGNSHPDVEALAIQARVDTHYRFDAPPMLFPSWSILLRTSAADPGVVPANSLANEVSDTVWGGSPWLLWTVAAPTPYGETETRQQQIQQQLSRAIAGKQSPYGAMESIMSDMPTQSDRPAQQEVPAVPLSEEQLSQLVQTMGLPRGKIEQLIETRK